MNSGVAELEAGLAVTPSTISVQKWDQISGTMVLSEESNPVYVAMASQLSEKRAELAEKLGEVEGLSRLVDSMNSDLNALQAELTEKGWNRKSCKGKWALKTDLGNPGPESHRDSDRQIH